MKRSITPSIRHLSLYKKTVASKASRKVKTKALVGLEREYRQGNLFFKDPRTYMNAFAWSGTPETLDFWLGIHEIIDLGADEELHLRQRPYTAERCFR